MGKLQIEELLMDRALQLGEEFDLKEFHDEFLAGGVDSRSRSSAGR